MNTIVVPRVPPPDPADHCVSICRTCPRNSPESGAFGLLLSNRLKSRLESRGIRMLMVTCLGSCRQSGTIVLDAPAKYRVRFADLSVADADMIATIIDAYVGSSSGELDEQALGPMRKNLSAVAPKPAAAVPARYRAVSERRLTE